MTNQARDHFTKNLYKGTVRLAPEHAASAEAMIAYGDSSGVLPYAIGYEDLVTGSGLTTRMRGVVGTYADASRRVIGEVGADFNATKPEDMRSLLTATAAAGATPDGLFSTCKGRRIVATFTIGKPDGTFHDRFVIADGFDGSLAFTLGRTTHRVPCTNVMSVVTGRGKGSDMTRFRHSASLEGKIGILCEVIAQSLSAGESFKKAYLSAERIRLERTAAAKAFAMLFPEADKDATQLAKTRAENVRKEARIAAMLPMNRIGTEPGNLATLWNAATFLVDRTVEVQGNQAIIAPRASRSEAMDSVLFGSRAKRVQEIQQVIEVVMADGSLQKMEVSEARDHGVDARQIARSFLADEGVNV